MEATSSLFTIGHSTHSIDQFLKLLHLHKVTAIADVRSSPYSRVNPQFSREALRVSLKSNGIFYVFLGRELGARSNDPTCYEHGKVQYARLAQTPAFGHGLQRLLKGSENHRIALMCAEKEPLSCHRTLLVSQALHERNYEIMHIHGNGELESHNHALARLPKVVGIPEGDLFQTDEDAIERARKIQEERIAFYDEAMAQVTMASSV